MIKRKLFFVKFYIRGSNTECHKSLVKLHQFNHLLDKISNYKTSRLKNQERDKIINSYIRYKQRNVKLQNSKYKFRN